MSDKVKILIQRRTSLKAQITYLANLLDKGKVDNTSLELRFARLGDLYHAYEEYNDELTIFDPSEAHAAEFTNIHERFYTLAARIKNVLKPASASDSGSGLSSEETRNESTSLANPVKKRKLKLPDAPLPTFDGKLENWLSFKNAFRNMIGSQTDLSKIDKLHYLKSALTGEAAAKVRILEVKLSQRMGTVRTFLRDKRDSHFAAPHLNLKSTRVRKGDNERLD